MSIEDTSPELSVPVPDPIGRLYRRPGSEPLRRLKSGKIVLPTEEVIHQNITDGTYLPSITNVLNARNAPHLLRWSAKKAAECAIDVETNFPGRIAQNPRKALPYLRDAAERDRDQAASQGTLIHNACEAIARGNEIPQLTPHQHRYLDNWKEWLDRWQPEFLHLEATVFGTTPRGLGYAGTTDFIARINGMVVAGDYKCASNDTMILMADKTHKRADQVRVGDEVVAYDEAKKDFTTSTVTMAQNNGVQPIYRFTFEDGGAALDVTDEHPLRLLYTEGQRWVQAKDVKVGSIVVTVRSSRKNKPEAYDRDFGLTRVINVEVLTPAATIALEVDRYHNHVTNGILTHNTTRSGLHVDLALQLSAVSNAQQLVLDNATDLIQMPKIDAAIGVHLSPERFRVAPVEIHGQVWDTFCALREVWNFHVFHGHLDNGDQALKEFISSPSDLQPLKG